MQLYDHDSDPHEYEKLLDTLTINVTKLFRNWETYEGIAKHVVPTLWNSDLKAITDKPVLVGIGVSTAEQAVTVCHEADGVIVGSALIRRLLDGEGPEGAAAFIGQLREGLDNG